MQSWLIYLPAIASIAAVGGAYMFLKASWKRLQRQRQALLAQQAGMPEPEIVHDALKPVETALEKAVRDIVAGVEQGRAATSESAEARPYA